MKYFIKAFQNYANFKGRARRKEYWYFLLFIMPFSMLCTIIDLVMKTNLFGIQGLGITKILFQLVVFLPTTALSVRRMHDVNKSGWYVLIPFYIIIVAFVEGNLGENKYGADPKMEQEPTKIT